MPSAWSATEAAFIMVAVIQAIFTVVWSISARLMATTREATLHWAGWAGLSATTWFAVVADLRWSPLFGLVAGVIGLLLLQRGIRLFIGREPTYRFQLGLLAIVLASAWIGANPQLRYVQAATGLGVAAVIYLDVARDLHAHAKDRLRFRWPVLLALPVLVAGIGFGLRALQAAMWPGSVSVEGIGNNTLNVGSAIALVALFLSLHTMLMTLVIGRFITDIHKLSSSDNLTNLLNRRAMEERIEAQIRLNRCDGGTFALMLLDLDHFKRINSQFGHSIGDLALKHVASLLRTEMRDTDRLARFGGEEFVVLMPKVPVAQAKPIAGRLRELVAARPFMHEKTKVPLSVSIGSVEWQGGDENSSQLLLRADAALFQAKIQGGIA